MFEQRLTPVFGAILPSFFLALLPIVIVLLMLGVFRRPSWQASAAGLAAGLIVSIGAWHFPVRLALDAIANGAMFALWPIMWVVFNALLLYNIAVTSGSFKGFRDWIIQHLPDDPSSSASVSARCSKGLPDSERPSRSRVRC